MKRLIFPLVAVIALLITGCSEKFKIAAPYKDITVVYGFLDKKDTAHYIRIQKAYLDENKNALAMAKEVDSNFYTAINVRIERLNMSDLSLFDTIHLNRVDLTAEGYPKQPGAFFDAPNYAYKFTNTLDYKYIYRLKITNLVTGAVDSADAPIIDDTDPVRFYVDALDTTTHTLLDFANTSSTKYFLVYGAIQPPPGYNYNGSNNPVAVGQIYVTFNWHDSDILTHTHTARSYEYNAGFFTLNNGSLNYKIFNNNVQASLASLSGLGIAPPNTIRLMDRCDLSLYVSTQEYNLYQQSTLIQGTGLTGTEIQPSYTNIKGENVLGLFTSRGMRTGKITLTSGTLDSLMHSSRFSQAMVRGTLY